MKNIFLISAFLVLISCVSTNLPLREVASSKNFMGFPKLIKEINRTGKANIVCSNKDPYFELIVTVTKEMLEEYSPQAIIAISAEPEKPAEKSRVLFTGEVKNGKNIIFRPPNSRSVDENYFKFGDWYTLYANERSNGKLALFTFSQSGSDLEPYPCSIALE